MEEVVEHVPPLNVLLSGAVPVMLLSPPRPLLLPPHLLPLGPGPRPVPALVPRCPELGGFLRGEADSLRLDTEELLPSRGLLGGDGGRGLPLGRGCGRLLTP